METDRPSRAKEFFDEIKLPGKGAAFLKQLVGSGISTFESEFLDFKGGQNLEVGGGDLLKLWAKNLSCFANSDGGVLIFGIDAPQGKPLRFSLVPDIAGLCERLKNLVPKITEPPVQRVEVVSFADPPDKNTGFVVCHIPASPWRPHQVRVDGQPGQFYVRATDNCIPCSHSTLRALFAPQFISRLEIFCQHSFGRELTGGWMTVILHFYLQNAGPATASELVVMCKPQPASGMPQYDHRFWTELNNSVQGYAFLATRSIHPEEKIPIFSVQVGTTPQDGNRMGPLYKNEVLRFKFSVSARNQTPIRSEIAFRESDLNEAADKFATPLPS